MKRGLFSLLIFVFSLSLFSIVYAKAEPYIEDANAEWGGVSSAWEVPGGLNGAMLFGSLGSAEDVDAFAFHLTDPIDRWSAIVTTPVCGDAFASVFPSLALIGPGLDAPADGALPFALPEGMGAQVIAQTRRDDRRMLPDGFIAQQVYLPTAQTFHVEEAGDYIVAVWEPEGNTGPYMLDIEAGHSMDDSRPSAERDAAFSQLNSGTWMRQFCNATTLTGGVAAINCDDGDSDSVQTVDDGQFVISGTVRDSVTCAPIANARVHYWLTNASGRYDAPHGYVDTDAQGGYEILSIGPGDSDPGHEVHLYIRADGYHVLTDAQPLNMTDTAAHLSFALEPMGS